MKNKFLRNRIFSCFHLLIYGTLPLWWWGELSDKFYDDRIAHDYKDGKSDYRLIRNWFLKQ